MPKRIVFLCFDKSEERELQAFERHKRYQANQINPGSGDDLQVDIIYPGDVSNDDYMTFGKHQQPNKAEAAILSKLTPNDSIYVWGHGSPNYAYIPGAFYTEVAKFIAEGVDPNQFSMRQPLKIHCEMCNGGRGGSTGEASFSGRLHAYLGKLGLPTTVSGRQRNVVLDFDTIRTEGLSTIRREYDALSHLIKLPASFYKYKEPGSKVTYQWQPQPDGMPANQVRVDSYRITLNKLASLIEKKLEEKSETLSSQQKTGLRKHILAVKLQLNDTQAHLDKEKLQKAMENLKTFITKNFAFTEDQFQDIGFYELNKRIMHHAQGGGLI